MLDPSLGTAPGKSYVRPLVTSHRWAPCLLPCGHRKALNQGFPAAPWDPEEGPSVGGLGP